jgi:hypothetical protein
MKRSWTSSLRSLLSWIRVKTTLVTGQKQSNDFYFVVLLLLILATSLEIWSLKSQNAFLESELWKIDAENSVQAVAISKITKRLMKTPLPKELHDEIITTDTIQDQAKRRLSGLLADDNAHLPDQP